MILIAVSAMPAITQKTQREKQDPSDPAQYTISISGGPVIDKNNWGKIVTNADFATTRKIPITRKLNSTKIVFYRLDGTQTDPIDARLAYFNINNINYEYNDSDDEELNFKTDLLSALVEQGLGNHIVGCWEIPDEYILVGSTDGVGYNSFHLGYDLPSTDPRYQLYSGGYGQYNTLMTKLKSDSLVYTPYSSYAQGVINNKARYGQSVTIKLYNPASGSSLTKHIYDALPSRDAITSDIGPDEWKPGQTSYRLRYRVAADIRPDGCPIFSFRYNDGGTDQLSHATEYIKGGSWRRVQLDVQALNGSYFEKLALNNARDELNTRTALTLVGSILGIAGGGISGANAISALGSAPPNPADYGVIGGDDKELDRMINRYNAYQRRLASAQGRMLSGMGMGAIGLAGSVGSYAISRQKLENQEMIFNARSATAVAPIQVGNSDFIKDTGMNKFYYVFTSYSGDDMWNFDAFLTRYGYNVGNMTIRNRHFYSRKRFVYVKVNECQLISNTNTQYQVGKQILEKVEQQLKQGVRIWRVKPDAHWLLPDGNNIKEESAYV